MRSLWLVVGLSVLLLQGCALVQNLTEMQTPPKSKEERRDTQAVHDDRNIEYTARLRIADKYRSKIQVNVTSFNRFVLITGQVPNDTVKQGVERIVGGISLVKGVANELQVARVATGSLFHSDSGISSDVRTRFLDNKTFNPDYIKVYTEDGVVYLLGIVTRAEADAAADVAATTRGVKKVVRVFEYLN